MKSFTRSSQSALISERIHGEMVCFGDNMQGQCNAPPDLGPVKTVAAGLSHTCAVKADGELVCFGDNMDGQCDVPPDLGPVKAVAAGLYHTCSVKVDGELVCFGSHAPRCRPKT